MDMTEEFRQKGKRLADMLSLVDEAVNTLVQVQRRCSPTFEQDGSISPRAALRWAVRATAALQALENAVRGGDEGRPLQQDRGDNAQTGSKVVGPGRRARITASPLGIADGPDGEFEQSMIVCGDAARFANFQGTAEQETYHDEQAEDLLRESGKDFAELVHSERPPTSPWCEFHYICGMGGDREP